MARQLSEANKREYDELRRFLEVWGDRFFPDAIPKELRPGSVMAAFEKQAGRPVPLTGVRQAVNDMLEWAEEFGPDQIAEADVVLREAGAPTLTQMLLRQSKTFKAILRRGRIRNDTEFYLVSEALGDTAPVRADAEIAVLNMLVADYEAKRRP